MSAEERIGQITEWLWAHRGDLEHPRGSLVIDWGDEGISFKPSRVDRIARRRDERMAS